MDSLASEGELLGAALLVDIIARSIINLTLAGEVRSVCGQGKVVGVAIRLGVGHKHMSTGKGSQSGDSESLREHFEWAGKSNVPDDRFGLQIVRLSSRQESSDKGIGLKSRSSIWV